VVFEKPGHFIGNIFWVIWDELIVDGVVKVVANFVRGVGAGIRFVQTGSVQFYAVSILLGIIITVTYFLKL